MFKHWNRQPQGLISLLSFGTSHAISGANVRLSETVIFYINNEEIMSQYVQHLIAQVKAKNPHEPEFLQAVEEVVESLEGVLERHPEYRTAKILERMVEPERVIMFRVPWMDDQGRSTSTAVSGSR